MLNSQKKLIVNIILRLALFSILLLLSLKYVKAQNCTVNAGIPETICDNETMQLQGNSTGLFTTTASWSQVGGPSVSITDPNNLSSIVTGYVSGQTYTFRISATCQDGVSVYDEVTIDVNPVTQANAGIDQQSCPGTAVITLNGNSPGTNETGQWTIQSNGGNVGGLTASNPSSTLDLPSNDAGNSTLRWSITHSNGCSSFDDVIITNYGGVLPVSAGNDQTLSNCYTTTQSTSLSGSYAGDGSGGQQGTWSLVSGPNYPTISNPNDENANISNLVEGVYVFRWKVDGPCASGSDEVTITVPGPTQGVTNANASNLRFCYSTTTAVLEGSIPQYANEEGTWVQTGGPAAIITTSNNSTTSVTGLDGSSDYIFTYTITNTATGCSNSHDNVYIRFTDAPTIDVGPDQVLDCGANSVTIVPSVTGGTNTRYKIISGPFTTPAWTGDNSTNVTINGLNQEGTYTIQFERYSVGSGCSSAFDVVNVSVADAPDLSNAGTDQNLACNVVETDLAGNAPSEGVGIWSQVSGPTIADISNVYDESSHISGLVEGQYIFRWVITGGNGCPVEQDEVTVNVATSDPAAAAGTNRTVCHSTEVILEGNTPRPGAVGEWSVTPGTGVTFSNINDPSASVFGMQANTAYTFTWTITNQCQVESADVIITTGSTAGPSPAFAGPDQCEATGTITLSMDGNTPIVGQGLWTVLSGPNSPTITDNTLPTTTVTGMIDGHYEIEWSINVPGCVSTRDTIMASIVSAVTQSNAGADESICGSAITLSANAPTANETGYWEQVSGNSGYSVSDITDYNATFSDLLPGRYEFAWIIEKGICPSSSDTLVLTVSEQPDASVTASDYTVCGGTTATLAANNPNTGTGVWSVIGQSTNQPNIASISSPTTTVSGLATGEYNFRWTITSGPDCAEEIDEITIQVSTPAVADPDQTLCNATETFLEGTIGSSGVWSIAPSNTGSPIPTIINNTSLHTANVTGMGMDEVYTFRFTIDEIYGCPSSFDSLTVSTSPYGTTPNAGPDQEICTSGGNSIVMAANSPGVGIGSWNQLSGPNSSNIDDASSNTTTIDNLIAGIYVFEWNVDYGNCGNYSDVVRIMVNDPPTVADAGTDQVNACQFDAQLSGNLPSVGIGIWTLVSAPTAHATTSIIIDNPNLPNTTISNITDLGDYEFMWTTTNGSVCVASTDNVILTFIAEPPTAPNAGSDQDLCDATSFNMAGNNPGTGTGTWTQISGPGGISITNPNSNNTNITGASAGIYEFQWEIVSGGCTLTDNVIITNSTTPPAADASGTDPDICQFDSPQLIGSDPTPGTGEWSFVSGPTTPIISTPGSTLSNVTNTTIGSYTFRWTVSNGACTSSSDDVAVTIVNNPLTNLTVSGNTVCDGADATVTISSSENLINYELFIGGTSVAVGAGDGSDIDITVPASELSVGTNYVDITATNSTGCAVTLDNQAVITVNANPLQTNPVSDDEVCENTTATITISSSVSGVRYDAYSGVTLVGTGNGNGGNLDISIPTDASWIGSNTITLTATNTATSCVSNLSNNSTITVNANPLTDRVVTGNTTCLGQNGTVTVALSETGINYEAFIGATSVGTGSGNDGDLDIAINAGDLVLGNNTIDLVATNATSSCAFPLANQATVQVINPPLIDRIVNGNTVCQNTGGTVTISASETGVTYELYNGATLVGTDTGTGSDLPITVNASGLSVGVNTINITASNTGCTENLTNQATINVNANPDASLSIDGSELCDLLNGTVTVLSSESGIDYEAFIGATSVATGTGDGSDLALTVLASNLSIGANTVQVVATNATTNCFINMNTNPVILINPNPNYGVVASGNTVCDEADATLTILSSEPGINYEAFIGTTSIGTAIGNGNDLLMTISSDDIIVGNNVVAIIASTTNNCIGTLNNQATITVNANPLSDLQIGDVEICNGDTAMITINDSQQDIRYELFINDELVGNGNGNGSALNIAIPFGLYEVGTSTVKITATNTISTCAIDMEMEPELLVTECKIIVYNGFSPNGDGINETFIIRGLINYPKHKVLIFNRWGNKVYEASPYLSDWDGTNMFGVTVGGKDLPVGTYYYIIEPGNGEKAIKGYIYLNR